MQLDRQRLCLRDAMASLSTAVNIIATGGGAEQCGIMATAACPVMNTLPSLMVRINVNGAMDPIFQGNGKLCVNVLNHEQELMARHFADVTGMAMEERFGLSCWQKDPLAQPVLKGSLASFEGEIRDVQAVGAHLVYLAGTKSIVLSAEGHRFTYFKCRFHPEMLEMETAI